MHPLLQPPAAKCVGAGPRVLLGQPAAQQQVLLGQPEGEEGGGGQLLGQPADQEGDGGRGDQGGADQADQEDFVFDYARISTKSKSPKEHCGPPTSEV